MASPGRPDEMRCATVSREMKISASLEGDGVARLNTVHFSYHLLSSAVYDLFQSGKKTSLYSLERHGFIPGNILLSFLLHHRLGALIFSKTLGCFFYFFIGMRHSLCDYASLEINVHV